MRMPGEQFKDLNFDNADPEDVMRWLKTGGVEKKELEFLNFQLGEGEYKKEFSDNFKKGVYLKWLAERSNDAVIEYQQKADNVTPLDIQAGNVASFFWALGKIKTEELTKSGKEEKIDLAFATSHQGILESFLYKVLKLKDERAAEELLENRPNGFKENEGFKVKFNLLG